jgi:cysteine synthase A
MKPFVAGPTYGEMLSGQYCDSGCINELDPRNLFNITWRGPSNRIRHIVLPRQLTGVDANILVLTGCFFPSGSHKVGAAYATLMEAELAGEIQCGVSTIVGPSTGNFGIGTAYVAKLKGYPSIVIMPDHMSAERYQRIRRYGGQLDLTPGSESDVILVLERTGHYKQDPKNKILAQFELFPNYRFHRFVTGRSAVEVAADYGNGRVAAFVAAPGSAGTLAAGDDIKTCFSDCLVCALEPKECSTLFDGGQGTHAIEGIGDKMVPLIHNVLTTDYVALIHDGDCLLGLDLLERQTSHLERIVRMPHDSLSCLRGLFGVSGICNILGAIRMARYLGLSAGDNVVTIATDGFDRYPSVLDNLTPPTEPDFESLFESIFRIYKPQEILDVRPPEQKDRLFGYKEEIWSRFGYSLDYLDQMKSQSFWDREFDEIHRIDAAPRHRAAI